MNSLSKLYLRKTLTNNYSTSTRSIYRFVLRNKYRRDTQPGLTRYNWDQLAYNQAPYEVNIFSYTIDV